MTQGICNKCGDSAELVLEGCVCKWCSDALDAQWAESTATAWALIAPRPSPVTKNGTAETTELFKRVYPEASYAEMKSTWAACRPFQEWEGGLDRSGAVEDIARMRALFASGLSKRPD